MTVCQYKQYHRIIAKAVKENSNRAGGVYTTEIATAAGLDKQVITSWLKENGYEKYGGHMSRYWQKVPA